MISCLFTDLSPEEYAQFTAMEGFKFQCNCPRCESMRKRIVTRENFRPGKPVMDPLGNVLGTLDDHVHVAPALGQPCMICGELWRA